MMRAIFRTIVAAIVGSALLSVPSRAQEKVTVALASGSVAYISYYAADAMGYFREAGLAPEMILTGSGAKALAAAVGGNVDLVMPTASEIMKARAKGIDLVMFGAVATQLGTSIVFSKDWATRHRLTKSSSLDERIAALKGIRLAISGAGSLTDAVVRFFAARGKLDPDRDMTLVGIPNISNAMMLAMDQGRVDGFVIAPPDTNTAEHTMGALIAFDMAAGRVPELAGYFHIGLAGTEKFVKSEKALKVARAFQMTLDAIHDPARTNQVRDKVHAANYPKVDPAIFADVWRNVIAQAPRTLQMNDAMFERSIVLDKIVSPEMNASMIKGSYTNVAADRARQ
jgi:NitT/TauT family transport system substrate-binding protein